MDDALKKSWSKALEGKRMLDDYTTTGDESWRLFHWRR